MCFRIELSCEQYGYGGDRTVSEEFNESEFLARQREALRGFRQAEARREVAETGAVTQRDDGLQAAEGELAGIKNEADGNLETVQTSFTVTQGELYKAALDALLDETMERRPKAQAEPLPELEQLAQVAVQMSESIAQALTERRGRRERRELFVLVIIFGTIGVLLVIAVLRGYRVLP